VAPVANAGTDQNVVPGSTVALDASRSTDANGDSIRYTWTLITKPQGSTAALGDASSAKPTFVADVPGTYVASVVASDGKLDSAAATVTITVAVPTAPVAKAGATEDVVAGSTVTLDASASTDVNGDTLTYAWTLTSKPEGSTASLSDVAVAKPTFVADVAGTYVATVVVSDGKLSSEPATVAITVNTAIGFDAIPLAFPPDIPGYGPEASALTGIGDRIAMQPGTPRKLASATVAMSSRACESGVWGDSATCVSGVATTFNHPVTIKIYDDSGNLLVQVTQSFAMPYRPSSNASCTGGQWKAENGNCYDGYAFRITFDLRDLNVTVPDVFAYDIVYNTTHYGPAPIGGAQPGPYDSLNVGVYRSSATSLTSGSDPDAGSLRWNGVLTNTGEGILTQFRVMAP
jgi:hypothetical protein